MPVNNFPLPCMSIELTPKFPSKGKVRVLKVINIQTGWLQQDRGGRQPRLEQIRKSIQ